MITRRGVLLAGGVGLLTAHPLSRGQSATMRRVGMVMVASEVAVANRRAAFKQGMHDLGWHEGRNVEYRFGYADGDVDRVDALVRELIAQKVDVLVTAGTPPTRAAQRATKTIPIVMASVANPVGDGFVASLAQPGGNITGSSNPLNEVLGKLIGIMHEVTPGARRLSFLLNERSPFYAEFWSIAQSACAALGLVALRVVASAPAQFGTVVGEIVRQRSQAVVVVSDVFYYNERVRLEEVMQATRLPVGYGAREHVAAGGLLSYGANTAANFRFAAKYVDKILKGAKPADLPVEQPTKFELVINLKAAKALGLTIPRAVLLRADEVI